MIKKYSYFLAGVLLTSLLFLAPAFNVKNNDKNLLSSDLFKVI
jgi:hypothetical protein